MHEARCTGDEFEEEEEYDEEDEEEEQQNEDELLYELDVDSNGCIEGLDLLDITMEIDGLDSVFNARNIHSQSNSVARNIQSQPNSVACNIQSQPNPVPAAQVQQPIQDIITPVPTVQEIAPSVPLEIYNNVPTLHRIEESTSSQVNTTTTTITRQNSTQPPEQNSIHTPAPVAESTRLRSVSLSIQNSADPLLEPAQRGGGRLSSTTAYLLSPSGARKRKPALSFSL